MRNSRSLLNMGMVIFLAIFISLFYFNKNAPDTASLLTHLSLNEISSIKIHRQTESKPTASNILLSKKTDGFWYMTAPYSLKAHQFRINTLLGLSQLPVGKTYESSSLDLSQYSLDKPRARITFNNTEIRFGKTSPLNNMRYFLAEGKMALLADDIYPLVSAQASSFIDLSLIPDNFRITKIRTPIASVFLNGDGKWINSKTEHHSNPLNADQIQTLLQHWNSVQAFAVHKYLPRKQPHKQLGIIEISSHTKTIVFHISDDDPWLILAIPELNIEYHLDQSQINLLYGLGSQDSLKSVDSVDFGDNPDA